MSPADVGGEVDLSLLSDMVGMRRGLTVMVENGLVPTPQVVLALMETEKAVYATDGGFAHKDQALGKIITAFRVERVSVADVLRATGVDSSKVKPKAGFLKRLLGR